MANQQKGGEKMDKQGGMYLFLKKTKKKFGNKRTF
jgi:hypothetical protein